MHDPGPFWPPICPSPAKSRLIETSWVKLGSPLRAGTHAPLKTASGSSSGSRSSSKQRRQRQPAAEAEADAAAYISRRATQLPGGDARMRFDSDRLLAGGGVGSGGGGDGGGESPKALPPSGLARGSGGASARNQARAAALAAAAAAEAAAVAMTPNQQRAWDLARRAAEERSRLQEAALGDLEGLCRRHLSLDSAYEGGGGGHESLPAPLVGLGP